MSNESTVTASAVQSLRSLIADARTQHDRSSGTDVGDCRSHRGSGHSCVHYDSGSHKASRYGGSYSIRASVDDQTWPSVFADSRVQRPDWIGPVRNLWDDKAKLEQTLARNRRKIAGDVKIVAVGVLSESCGPDGRSKWAARLNETHPSRIDASWPLLGYDVADEYLESAYQCSLLLAKRAKMACALIAGRYSTICTMPTVFVL